MAPSGNARIEGDIEDEDVRSESTKTVGGIICAMLLLSLLTVGSCMARVWLAVAISQIKGYIQRHK